MKWRLIVFIVVIDLIATVILFPDALPTGIRQYLGALFR